MGGLSRRAHWNVRFVSGWASQPELPGATEVSTRRRRQHARYHGPSKSVTATCVEHYPDERHARRSLEVVTAAGEPRRYCKKGFRSRDTTLGRSPIETSYLMLTTRLKSTFVSWLHRSVYPLHSSTVGRETTSDGWLILPLFRTSGSRLLGREPNTMPLVL